MKKPGSMKIIAPLMLSAGLFGAACSPATAPMGDIVGRQHVQAAPTELLAAREASYQVVFDQAQRHGVLAGALRGAMLGLLIDGERGAVVGATFGAVLGSAYAVTTAENLLQEREEFLNRQQIIENILDASRGATERSLEDAELVSRAVSEHLALGGPVDPEVQTRIADSITTIRHATEMRAVLIEEMLHEAELSADEQEQVRAEITLQREALREIRTRQAAWSTQANG